MSGDDVFRKIADLHLLIEERAANLKLFLGTVTPGHPALEKLARQVTDLTDRLQKLADWQVACPVPKL